jgi:hypothetical protein
MAMGTYDETEHERRAQKTGEVDAEFDAGRTTFQGTVEFDAGDSAEALLDQFRELQDPE